MMDATNLSLENIPANGSCNDEKSSDISQKEVIFQQVQDLIDEVNAKWKPEALMAQYRNDLEKHVEKRCSLMNEHITNMYEEHNRMMQEKLYKLGDSFQNAAKAEAELQEFKRSLAILYQEIHQELQ